MKLDMKASVTVWTTVHEVKYSLYDDGYIELDEIDGDETLEKTSIFARDKIIEELSELPSRF